MCVCVFGPTGAAVTRLVTTRQRAAPGDWRLLESESKQPFIVFPLDLGRITKGDAAGLSGI